MAAIKDGAGVRLAKRYLTFDLSPGEETAVFQVIVTVTDGAALLAVADADVQVLARVAGSGDPFVDVNTIDLSAHAPDTDATLDVKVKAAAVLTGVRRARSGLWAVDGEAAAWSA
jgi:hypothetical protein